MAPLAYNLALALASPLLLLYLLYRLAVTGKSREGFLERLGRAPRLPPPRARPRLWLHAVSAGEAVAAAAIARRLEEIAPEVEIVVSATTPAGRAQAAKLLPRAAALFYFPFDFLPCAALALARVKPTVVACVETEIWPNWLWLARLRGARAALVNGQFADRGFSRARRARPLYRWALGNLDALSMQSALAARRARFLGAPPERVRVAGNVKLEQPLQTPSPAAAARLRAALGEARPIFAAASTHPGEEEIALEAFRRARRSRADLALLLAPRHIERCGEVAELLDRQGWRWSRRTGSEEGPADVLLLDTMGELAGLYALVDVVFVGGSLVPVGGHDLLQPLLHGRPVLFGPHVHNQREVAALLAAEGAAAEVGSAEELSEKLLALLAGSERETMVRAGARVLSESRGAARECALLLADLAAGREPARATVREPSGSPSCS